MCGINGFNFEDIELLEKMCNLIKHRGPDDYGYYTDSSVSLGIRRLSIIDIEKGHQPQFNENRDIWIIFNGEIYNFIKLRSHLENLGHIFYTNSDTEVVLHAYEQWGLGCLKELNGPFAFCIYDSVKKQLFLARDRLGLKPLYYYFDEDKFIFASEIKSILCHEIEREFNKEAFNYFLSFKYIPCNRTLFSKISKVSPSSYILFDLKEKHLISEKYWNIDINTNSEKSEEFYAKGLRLLLEKSVKERLMSEVPLGAFLSGGIDSSSIVALMSKFIDTPLRTFSIGFEQGAPVDETYYAKLVADYYNTDHKELRIKSNCYEELPNLVWYLDDLIADPAIIPVYYLSKFAKDKISVALTGDGADEIFAGYSVYYESYKKNIISFLPKSLFDFTTKVTPNLVLSSLLKFYNYIPSNKFRIVISYLSYSNTESDRLIRTLLTIPDIEKTMMLPYKTKSGQELIKSVFIKDLDLIKQHFNFDINYQLPNQYNIKTDKMSMAVSLEARVPFLDYKVVEFASKIPSNLKLRNNIEKYILRLAMKDLLPKTILRRKKLGFSTPVNLWLNRGFKDFSEMILKKLEKRKQIISPFYVEKIRKKRLKRIYESRIWILMMFELWYETFFDNNEDLRPLKLNSI